MPGSLPPDLEEFVNQEVMAGAYETRDQVLAEGVRLLQERTRKLQRLRGDIQTGLEQLERGECIEIPNEEAHRAFFEDIRARGRARLGAKQPE